MAGVEEHRRERLDRCSLTGETVSPALEHGHGVGVEIDATPAGACLHWAFDGVAHRDLTRPHDRQAGGVGVEVAPVQTGEFTASHAGVGDEVQGWVEPEVVCDLEELGELLGVPDGRHVERFDGRGGRDRWAGLMSMR